jgi:nucleotide-binding universal stress UspA family protein
MVVNGRIFFERILCPIDLTPESDEALRYGIALARGYRAKLVVVHCSDVFTTTETVEREYLEKEIEAAIRRHVHLPSSPSVEWETLILDGEADTAITRAAAERHIDLIVMRSRRRPVAAALLGSTAETVCRTAPCPVLVTHPSEEDWAGLTTNDLGLQRVLVAYDYSSDSELALSYGLSLAQEFQAELHLLHVLSPRIRHQSPDVAFLPFGAEGEFQDAAARLQSAVPAEARMWCRIKQAVRSGHPYREVLDYAEENKIDLISMGASGTGFGMRALFGSNADRVLRQAPCPVLIARPLRPMVVAPAAATA